MISSFTDDGLLPRGIHEARWELFVNILVKVLENERSY